MNETHGADLRSWVESANDPQCDFPVQNLPLGIFRPRNSGEDWRAGAAIGEMVFDVAAAGRSGLLHGAAARAAARCAAPSLNGLMSLGAGAAGSLRLGLSRLLRTGTDEESRARRLRGSLLHAMTDVELKLPVAVGNYTDFYASQHHALNVGRMLRPDSPLLPNYKWIPIGYHGRASSIVVSGTPVRRPCGQTRLDETAPPVFGPTSRLDYEAEAGFLIGEGNALGTSIGIDAADEHLFGLCLVNDWSARDIQAWEYQPLGPFLGKNFATTISPWVVMLEAVEPFRAPAAARPAGDPQPLPYLAMTRGGDRAAIAATVEVFVRSATMRGRRMDAVRLSKGDLSGLYWTPAQFVAHHTSNGCDLQPGDLLASGTISGSTKDSRGCMLELTWRGTEPIELPSGEHRRFLEDGDEVILRGRCERDGFASVGFGECRGEILPAEGTVNAHGDVRAS